MVGTDTAAAARIMQAQETGGPGGAQGRLSLDSSVSVVMTDLERNKGEQASLGGSQSGEGTREVGTGTTRSSSQVEDTPWTEVVHRTKKSQDGDTDTRNAAMSSLMERRRRQDQGRI